MRQRVVAFIVGGISGALFRWLLSALFLLAVGVAPAAFIAEFIGEFRAWDAVQAISLVAGIGLLLLVVYAALAPERPRRSRDAVPEMSTREAGWYLQDDAAWQSGPDADLRALYAVEDIERAARRGEIAVWGRE